MSNGVGAINGAISNVQISDGQVEHTTIGEAAAVGICGSGLIDVLAEMLRAGIMTRKAKLKEPFRLTYSIAIAQEDVYQLITAKAGLRADQDLLLKYYGVDLDDIDTIYPAGAFGNYINVQNAVAIGLLPDRAKIVAKIGNAALAGAGAMLVSASTRKESEECAANIEHVKPNEREPDFDYIVAENMYF